jgi:hypothetical protein
MQPAQAPQSKKKTKPRGTTTAARTQMGSFLLFFGHDADCHILATAENGTQNTGQRARRA